MDYKILYLLWMIADHKKPCAYSASFGGLISDKIGMDKHVYDNQGEME